MIYVDSLADLEATEYTGITEVLSWHRSQGNHHICSGRRTSWVALTSGCHPMNPFPSPHPMLGSVPKDTSTFLSYPFSIEKRNSACILHPSPPHATAGGVRRSGVQARKAQEVPHCLREAGHWLLGICRSLITDSSSSTLPGQHCPRWMSWSTYHGGHRKVTKVTCS